MIIAHLERHNDQKNITHLIVLAVANVLPQTIVSVAPFWFDRTTTTFLSAESKL